MAWTRVYETPSWRSVEAAVAALQDEGYRRGSGPGRRYKVRIVGKTDDDIRALRATKRGRPAPKGLEAKFIVKTKEV